MESLVFIAIAFLMIPLASRFTMPRETDLESTARHYPFGVSNEVDTDVVCVE